MRKGVQSPSSAPPWVILSSLCMGSWATSFILLDPNNDSQVETSNTILSRQTQTMSTGSLLLREESEHLQTQHVKNRTTLVLSHHHLQSLARPDSWAPCEASAPWSASCHLNSLALVLLVLPPMYLLNPPVISVPALKWSLKSNC